MTNSSFDESSTKLLADTLTKRYQGFLEDEFFAAKHERYADNVRLTVLLERRDGSQRWVWQALAELPTPKQETEALFLLVDFLDAYLSEFFSEGRSIRPQQRFVSHPFREQDLYLRGRRRDLAAEKEAAQLLGEELEADFPEEA